MVPVPERGPISVGNQSAGYLPLVDDEEDVGAESVSSLGIARQNNEGPPITSPSPNYARPRLRLNPMPPSTNIVRAQTPRTTTSNMPHIPRIAPTLTTSVPNGLRSAGTSPLANSRPRINISQIGNFQLPDERDASPPPVVSTVPPVPDEFLDSPPRER